MKKRELRQILARNIEQRMERTMGLETQPALAAKAGIAQSQVSRILRAEIGVGLDILAALSDALGCDPWELLIDEEHTRKGILERILRGEAASDARVEQHIPALPGKVVAMRHRKK